MSNYPPPNPHTGGHGPPPQQQHGYGQPPYQQPPYAQQPYGQPHPPPPNGAYPQQPYGSPAPQYPPQGYNNQQPGYPPPPGPYGQPPQAHQGHYAPAPGPQAQGHFPPPQPSQYPPPQHYPPPQGVSPYGAPPHGAPVHGAPVHGVPAHGAPTHGVHGAPGYGVPPPVAGMHAHAAPPNPAVVKQLADAIYKACKGFGTNEEAIIRAIANQDGPTIDAIRQQYKHGDLIKTLNSELSGKLRTAVVSVCLGPIESAAYFANLAIAGVGTKESILTEAIMCKSNAELSAIKNAYNRKHGSLDAAVRSDLSMKTEKLFMLALEGRRPDEWIQANPQQAATDAAAIYSACRGVGTDQMPVCRILTGSNDAQIKAISYEFGRSYGELTKTIRSEFAGHMRDALLYIVEGALDKPKRDARLLEESMSGAGTNDEALISRLVRIHWDPTHLANVKATYKHMYGKDLASRISSETSGDYKKMLLAMVR